MENADAAYTASWEEAFRLGVNEAGGKGWNLSRLSRYGFRIPLGWVLTTTAYRHFIDFNRLEEPFESASRQINIGNLKESAGILSDLRVQITNAAMPPALMEAIRERLAAEGLTNKAVAVRSSASAEDSREASFAGIHDTFLNVKGLDNIMEAIKGCYASLWTPRAVAYRRKLTIDDLELQPAVIIMEMVAAQSSGVAFSCDPQSGRRDLMIINANYGLGESVVSGAIEPDTYCLTSSIYTIMPEIKHKNIGSKLSLTRTCEDGGVYLAPCGDRKAEQALDEKDIKRLGNLITRVLDALGDDEEPQDIEWAFDGKDFFLLQARPVTTLPDYTFAAIKNQPPVWSNANYRDALPMVLSPLHRYMMKNIVDTIWFTTFSKPGYPVPEGLQFSRFFNGRLYCNISAVYWAQYDCNGVLPRDLTVFWGGHQPDLKIDDPAPFQGEAGLRRQKTAMRNMALCTEAGSKAANTFAEVAAGIENLAGEGFKDLPDAAFIARFESLGEIVQTYSEQYAFLGGAGGISLGMLIQILYGTLGPRTFTVVNGLMAGGEASITSADHGYRLVELAQLARQDKEAAQYFNSDDFDPVLWEKQLPENSPFKQAFRQFLKEYGHRAVYELDIINPRWQEDPSYLLGIIRTTMDTANLDAWRSGQKEKFNRVWEEITVLFSADQREEIRKTIGDAQQGAGLREMTKSILVLALRPYRMMALELGNRWARRGLISAPSDIFFCTWPEIFAILSGEWNGNGLKLLVQDRLKTHEANEKLVPPDIIQEDKASRSEPVIVPSGNYLQGIGAAAGKTTGIARLIGHPAEGKKLQPGEILVAPSTDPGWTPLFLKAGALVMETGGYISHGAIVAREYGIPAVINVPGIMKAVQNGRIITVDGDEGRIYLP